MDRSQDAGGKEALSRYFGRFAPRINLRGGEALARIGQPISGLYRLEAGRIAELKPSTSGGSQIVAIHRPGVVLGGLEALGDGVHQSDLVALRDSELRALPIRKAEALLRRDTHVLAEVARAALRRLGAQQPDLRRRLLGRHVQRATAGGAQVGERHRRQRRLSDAGRAADQDQRARHDAAAEHVIELADPGAQPVVVHGVDLAERDRLDGRRAAAARERQAVEKIWEDEKIVAWLK